MRVILSVCLLLFLFSCNSKEHQVLQKNGTVDIGNFKITIPDNWGYVEQEGVDSFVGKFVAHSNGEKYSLSFDFSQMGYANSLLPSETEFVYDQQWQWIPIHYFIEPGTIYTSGDIEATRKEKMQAKGITDSSLIKVEPIPEPEVKIVKKYNDSISYDYLAYLTCKDSTVVHRIDLPERILKHRVSVDTVGHFRRKLIQPESGHSGMTGVYFEDLFSELNFQINGKNLPIELQEQATETFKSIKIK
jgi:hypothetical protein